MSKNKLTTNWVSLFLGILITTSTIFSALVIILPFNNVFAEQTPNTETFQVSPTKDKKQFCETGQFAGFYVSSAEFCNLEIAPGAPGPAGQPGISVLNSSNIYRVVGPIDLPNERTGEATSSAGCDPGDLALGGLSVFRGLEGMALQRIGTGTISTDLPTSYITRVIGADQVQSIATCFDNPPLHTTTTSASSSTFLQPEDSSRISQGIGDLSAEDKLMKKINQGIGDLSAEDKLMKKITNG